jgi:hypothetical protein
MDAPAATLDPLLMQDAVDRFGGRTQPALCRGPGITKPLGRLASAEKARSMARRKSVGFIEEEQLGPASASHDGSTVPFVLTATDEPGLGGLFSSVFVAGSWMMPRLPVNMPLWDMATISPKGVTRF